MKRIWIIGAGKFGCKAAESIRQQMPVADIAVVDREPSLCLELERQGFQSICMEGVDFLNRLADKRDLPDRIIPAVPIHLAYEWIRQYIYSEYRLIPKAVPGCLAESLPNPFRGKHGELYISNADFICPDNCSEPESICTHTGRPRPRILHRVLSGIRRKNFRSIVITSRQLLPGVGGYPPQALFDAVNHIRTAEGPVLLSTACRCHGVMHAFRVERVTDRKR